jgi:predicted transcriptional regulator
MARVTIEVPDHVYRRAEALAFKQKRSLSDVVAAALDSLPPASGESKPGEATIDVVLEAIHRKQRRTGMYFSAEERFTRDELYAQRHSG